MQYSMLIVDDERIERQGLSALVERYRLPVACQTAENGKKALEIMENQAFDLLLTDIKMPFMDGLTLAHEVRRQNPDMIIIILSAYRDFEKAQSAIDERVYRYLLKPVDPSQFREMMLSCLQMLEKRREENQKQTRMEEDLRVYRRMEAQLRSCLQDDSEYIEPDLVRKLLMEAEDNRREFNVDNPAVQQTLWIIHREYMKDISLEEIADRVGLNYGYLSTLFHQQTGQSFVRYLNSLRLEIAAQMLRKGNVKVNEVAQKVGFQRDSYFIASFRQRFGLTPKSYSQQMGEKPRCVVFFSSYGICR